MTNSELTGLIVLTVFSAIYITMFLQIGAI